MFTVTGNKLKLIVCDIRAYENMSFSNKCFSFGFQRKGFALVC